MLSLFSKFNAEIVSTNYLIVKLLHKGNIKTIKFLLI